MIAWLVVLVFLAVVAEPNHAPCYEAYLGDNSAAQNINYLRAGIVPAKPTTENDVWMTGLMIYQQTTNFNVFTGIAWADDTLVIVWRCDEFGGDFCTQFNPKPMGIVNYVSQSINGNKNWRSFALQPFFQPVRAYVTRAAVQYLASGRPWFGQSGWVSYDFVNPVTGTVQGLGYSYTWSTKDSASQPITMISDYGTPADPIQCNRNVTSPCAGATWKSIVVAGARALATNPVSSFSNEQEAIQLGKTMHRLAPGRLWMAVAFNDDNAVFVEDCSVPGSPVDLCNSSGRFIINVVSPTIYTNNVIHTFSDTGLPIRRGLSVTYSAKSRPWFSAGAGWIAYDFYDTSSGKVTGRGYSYISRSVNLYPTGGIICVDYTPLIENAVCNPDWGSAPCAGEARASPIVKDVQTIGQHPLLATATGFTTITQALNIGRAIVDVITNSSAGLWVSVAYGNDIITVQDCLLDPTDAVCDSFNVRFVVSVISQTIHSDSLYHAYQINGAVLPRAAVYYVPSQRPWYNQYGWVRYAFVDTSTTGDVKGIGYSFVGNTQNNAGIVVSDYKEPGNGYCEVIQNDNLCSSSAVHIADATNVAVLADVKNGFSTFEEAIQLGKSMLNVAIHPIWLGAAYGDSLVMVWDCQWVTNAVCNGYKDKQMINIVSSELFGNNSWHSFLLDGTVVDRPDLAYVPQIRPWWSANGWVSYLFIDGSVGWSYVIPQGEVVVVTDYGCWSTSTGVNGLLVSTIVLGILLGLALLIVIILLAQSVLAPANPGAGDYDSYAIS